jgi:leucine-rich repeat protein SHOC2
MESNYDCKDQNCWHNMFKKLFANEYDANLKYLKMCGCFSENNWKDNIKHALHRKLNSECETYSRAQEYIRMIFYTQQERLLLSDIPLTHLPTNIGTLTNLSCITLNEMDIHALPSDMRNLVNVRTINITKCPIYEIPEWFGTFKNLHTLNFSRCRISKVPISLSNCTKLDTLCLGYNQILRLPNEILEMPSLERLSIDCNPITISWKETMLPNCVLLSMMQTDVIIVPEYIVSRLFQLIWSGCEVTLLPSNMGTTLTHIDLARNHLSELPSSFAQLVNLNYLNISNNQFTELPRVLIQMPWIKKCLTQNNLFSKNK